MGSGLNAPDVYELTVFIQGEFEPADDALGGYEGSQAGRWQLNAASVFGPDDDRAGVSPIIMKITLRRQRDAEIDAG